jgi:regulator of protease activity HflC (stomatin/prohibitin superfamily)
MAVLLSVILILVVLGILFSGLRIAPEYQRAVVFGLGRHKNLRGSGLQ